MTKPWQDITETGEAGSASQPPPSFQDSKTSNNAPVFRSQFACVTFNMTDRIRLINFPQEELAAVQEVVRGSWPLGIQRERPYGESHEIKVNGRPWSYDSHGINDSRRLVLRILERLYDMGWMLQGAMDITNKSVSKDSLIFRKQNPAPPPCDWICISFDGNHKLKIVGSPSQELSDTLAETFGSELRSRDLTQECLKIHFNGLPWMPSGTDTIKTRLLLLKLIESLETCGFTLYASIGSRGDDEEGAPDILVCQRQKGWMRGAPIWHR